MQFHAPVYAQKAIKSLPFIVRWLNNLHILPRELTPKTIFDELSNGLILLAICELMLDVQFDRFERKPIARRACLNNIELALSVVWKKNICSSHMCTAEDFYNRAPHAVTSCLMEIMEVATFREVRTRARAMMEEFDAILCEHNRAMCETTCTQPTRSVESLVRDFSTGIRVVLLLARRGVVEERFLRDMMGKPESQEDYVGNLSILVKALQSGGIPVYLSAKEFLSPPIPCPESLLLQLNEIWRAAFDDESRNVALSEDVRFADDIPVTLATPEKPTLRTPNTTAQLSSESFHVPGGYSLESPRWNRASPSADPSKNKTPQPVSASIGHKTVSRPKSEARGGTKGGQKYSVATALAFLGHQATIADLRESLSLPSLRNHLQQHRLSPVRMEEIAQLIKDDNDEVDMVDFAHRCDNLLSSSSNAVSARVDDKVRTSLRTGKTNTALRDDSRKVAAHAAGARPAPLTTNEEPTIHVTGASVQFNSSGLVVPGCTIWSEVLLHDSHWLHTINFADSTMATFLQLDTGQLEVPRSGCLEVPDSGILHAVNTECVSLPPEALMKNDSAKLAVQLRGAHAIYNFSEEIRILAHFIRHSKA